jgi:LAS superfamily LD-carboxypeptidase LdcB
MHPFERAVLEAVVGGQIVHSGHTHRHGHDTHPVHVVNGRIPPSQLTPVGDGQRMAKVAGARFRKMDAAANAAGIDLKVRSGYRTYAEQAVLYDRYIHGRGPLAARPGHSTHGLGLSADIDVSDPRTLAWLRKHAARFGFVPDVPSENWHWTYRPR